MNRYSCKTKKNPREVVLLKGAPCKWGKCAFCDYIIDNLDDSEECHEINAKVLENVKGTYRALEVINSGNVFELPHKTLELIKKIAVDKKIEKLYFECHYIYKDKIEELRAFFGIPLIIKLGLETFDEEFRNKILNKGIYYRDLKEVTKNFDSICLLVGVKGQTREMIKRDIEMLVENFEFGCINIYQNNSTAIEADEELIIWYKEEYGLLELHPNIDVLYEITDFDVGQKSKRDKIQWLVKSAMIAAIYVLFCFIVPSYGEIQFRISELLVLLVFFNKKYSYAIIIGCFIANCFSPLGIVDVIFGTIATILTCLCVAKCRHLFAATLVPVAFCFIVGLELYYFLQLPLVLTTLYVMAGEFAVVTIIGYPLYLKLSKNKDFLTIIDSKKELKDKKWKQIEYK